MRSERLKAMIPLTTYLLYLVLSIGVAAFVAHTLYRRGRVFLLDTFRGNEILADSINHLRRIGFYLITVGYVAMSMSWGKTPGDLVEATEFLSARVGVVLLLVGFMHVLATSRLTWMRRRAEMGKVV